MGNLHQEILRDDQVRSRLIQLRANYMKDKSTQQKHVYWSPSINYWIAVERSGPYTRLTYSTTCPCKG